MNWHVIIAIATLLSLPFSLCAQNDDIVDDDAPQPWAFKGSGQINFSQAAFVNWAAGGDNSFSGTGIARLHLQRTSEKLIWSTWLRANYGKLLSNEVLRKSEDQLELESKLDRPLSEKVALSGYFLAQTQFDEGFDYPNDTVVVSRFLSPGYLTFGAGISFKPEKWISFLISPATGKLSYVHDTLQVDATRYGIDSGRQFRAELGSYATLSLQKELFKNVNLNMRLKLFSNYLKEPQNVDIAWDVLFNLKVNDFMQASISTKLIYDHDVQITRERDGKTVTGPTTQFKEVLAIGLTFKFGQKASE